MIVEDKSDFYRTYKIKCYLNARHYILINGKKGQVHPHTWEFMLEIKFLKENFIEFGTFEKSIIEYLSKYQNQIINDIEPFDFILPTLENITDTFAKDFQEIIENIGGLLINLEASETPTRMYAVNVKQINQLTLKNKDEKKSVISNAIDTLLDEILR